MNIFAPFATVQANNRCEPSHVNEAVFFSLKRTDQSANLVEYSRRPAMPGNKVFYRLETVIKNV